MFHSSSKIVVPYLVWCEFRSSVCKEQSQLFHQKLTYQILDRFPHHFLGQNPKTLISVFPAADLQAEGELSRHPLVSGSKFVLLSTVQLALKKDLGEDLVRGWGGDLLLERI